MWRIAAVTRMEFLHIIRDLRSLVIVVFLPMVALILFGYALTFEIKNAPVAIWDENNSQLSRNLADRIHNSIYFDVKYRINSASQLDSVIDSAQAVVALRLPADFSEKINSKKSTAIQIIVDGSDNQTASQVLSNMQVLIQNFSSEIFMDILQHEGKIVAKQLLPIDFKSRVWYNQELKHRNYLIPGLLGVVLMMTTTVAVSLAIAREQERGTIERIMVSPIARWQYIMGKLLPYIGVAIIDMLLIFFSGLYIFKVPFRGNFWLLMGLSALFFASALGMGLFISTIARTQQMAWLLSLLTTFLPSMILSGFVFPIRNMPIVIQLITYLLPIRYYMVILRGVILKGIGLNILWQQAAALIIFNIIIIFLTSIKFKKRIA
jgi:ABC-2 type transport system permease protein